MQFQDFKIGTFLSHDVDYNLYLSEVKNALSCNKDWAVLVYNIFGSIFFRYVPPLLWGKNGHLQTVVYAKMGRMRDPVPSGTRHTKTLQDGSTLTFDFYQPTANHHINGT